MKSFQHLLIELLLLTLKASAQDVPGIAAENITFYNNCSYPLTLRIQINDEINPHVSTLPMQDHLSVDKALFNLPGGLVFAYPNLPLNQCPDCDNWTDVREVGQREGYMWEGENIQFARFCNPSLSASGHGICALQGTCCGPDMTQDGTFGTLFEITTNGASSQDYPDLSTNFGSGPRSPPHLCPSNPNDCVVATANIFFNIPIRWSINIDCTCTSQQDITRSSQCLEASCPDAYQHPTDDKQCHCPTNGSGYLVEYCPGGDLFVDIETGSPVESETGGDQSVEDRATSLFISMSVLMQVLCVIHFVHS